MRKESWRKNVVGEYVKKIGMRRILIMLLGNVFLGMGVSIFKFDWSGVMMRIMP